MRAGLQWPGARRINLLHKSLVQARVRVHEFHLRGKRISEDSNIKTGVEARFTRRTGERWES